MKNIILVGSGGHAKSCVDVIEKQKKYKIIGFIDNFKKGNFLNYKILGSDKILKKIFNKTKYAFVTIGHLNNPKKRTIIYKKLKLIGFKLPVIKSPHSVISNYSKIGEGSIVMHGAILNAGSKIGRNCILNSLSLIEHDVTIGDFSHVSTNAVVNGDVKIGSNCFLGSCCVIKQGIKIRSNSFIKSNQLVKSDLLN